MVKNYLILAWRNIFRNKSFSLIKILGMAVAIAAFILIFQYVRFELGYDRYHSEANQIYRVAVKKEQAKGQVFEDAYTFSALGPAIKDEVPGVKDYFRLSPWANSYTAVYKSPDRDEPVSLKTERVIFADGPFARYFSLDFVAGEAGSLLAKPNNAFISNSLAEKYFGPGWRTETNPVGKELLVYTSNRDAALSFRIGGVYRDMPVNSHLHYDMILSHSSLMNYLPPDIPAEVKASIFADNWGNYSWYTYIVLDASAHAEIVEKQINELVARKKNTGDLQESFFLQPVTDIHLKSKLANEASVNSSLIYVYVMAGMGLLILLLAWINYTNLSIAGFLERTEEIGLRKAIGSGKRQIVAQLFTEALIFNLIAVVFGFFISKLTAPLIYHFTGFGFGPTVAGPSSAYLVMILFGLLLAGSVLASLYPSVAIASMRSIEALKGQQFAGSRFSIKKYLLVFQFTISMVLIMGTILNYRQIGFMRSQDLGINTERILVVEGPNAVGQEVNFAQTITALRNETARYPAISQVTASNSVPGKMALLSRPLFQFSKENEGAKEIREIQVDPQYFPMLDIRLLAGRNFTGPGDSSQKVILNETAIGLLGFESPGNAINQKVGYYWAGGKGECEVIGVVEDFHQHSLKYDKEPIGFYNEIYSGDYLIKIASGAKSGQDISQSIALLEGQWRELFPGNPFNYYFLDSFFDQQYQADQRFGSIFSLFSALGIFIACMGLFCLSLQTIAKRTKEIGIRKVNGARVSEILSMLNRDFVKWVAIAFVIATPIAWYAMNKWLENFAYKTSLSWWIFALAGLLALGIALLTVSWQSWKTATRNPVEALRYE